MIFVPATKQTILLQIICHNPPPSVCNGVAADQFGLQDKKGALDLGTRQADDTRVFTCSVEAKLSDEGVDFGGAVVQGTKGNRFLYLSWAYDTGGWIKRIKVPLASITLQQIRAGHVLQAVIENGRTSGTVKPEYGWKTV
jgi:hypothetical protein